jgi:hypothetical protein
MQCPKCGHNNSDDAQMCQSCNSALPDRDASPQKTPAKTSRLAILSLVFGVLSFHFFILTGIPGIILGMISYRKIKHSSKLTGKFLAKAGVIFSILFIVYFILWKIDASPIPNDYTIKNLKSAKPQYNYTYSLLQSLADQDENLRDAPAIGLSADDVKFLNNTRRIFEKNNIETITQHLEKNEGRILSIWQNALKGRNILNKLDSCPEIADLTKPKLESLNNWLINFKYLVFLHQQYIYLQCFKGNYENAYRELKKLDSLFKKISVNARPVITKLVCIACLSIDIQIATFIINNPDTPNEIVLLIEQNILPISKEYSSLRNPMIFEYLTFKYQLSKFPHQNRSIFSRFTPLKFNSTLRLYRNFHDKWISITEHQTPTKKFRVWPFYYPNIPVEINSEFKLPWYYKLYNPAGSFFAYILTLNIEKIFEIKTRLEILSDLLQIALNKRIGKEINLKARAYSDKYIIDTENKIIFSPGPDGESGTKDDIKLPINPEVLGLTELSD